MADVGTTLNGNRGEYELTAFLGDGLTARVFAAKASYLESPVAVKVLKPGLPPEIIARFQTEFKNVTDVNSALATASGSSGNGDDVPASPPAFHEFVGQQDDQPAFLVLELMTGQLVERLLIEEGPFQELLGLQAGVQLFGLFHVLHREVGTTYDDFKFENLWWEANGQRLRVTDWNVLGDPIKLEANIPRDLVRAARALVRILTGVSVSRGQRLDLHPGWETLSDGVQRMLLRLLDVDENRRPRSADEVRQELRRLVGYWLIAPERGLRMAEAALAGAGSSLEAGELDDETRRTVEQTTLQTLDLLSVLHARQVTTTAEQADVWPAERVHQLDELHAQAQQFAPSAGKMLEGALSLLRGGSAGKALEQLQRSIRVFPDDLRAFRWCEYAEAVLSGKAGPEGQQKQWRNAIEVCQNGDYVATNRKLHGLDEKLAPALRYEVAIHTALEEADKAKTPLEALKSTSRANEALQDLSGLVPGYGLAVERHLGISLAEVVQLRREEAAAADREDEVKREIAFYEEVSRSPVKFPDGATHAQERLRQFTDQAKVVMAALELGEKCLEHKDFDSARRIFAAGAVLKHDHVQDYLLRWQVANAAVLRKAEGNGPVGEITAREVETARKSIEEATETLDPGSPEYKKLNGWLKHIDPEGPKLTTRQFTVAFDAALREDPKKTVSAIGDKLKAQQLATALSLALDRDKLDQASKTTLLEIIRKHMGLSKEVLTLLTAQRPPVKIALAQAVDADAAATAIAQAVKLPQDIDRLRRLMNVLPSTIDRTKLANQLRDLAFEFGAQGEPFPGPYPGPVPPPPVPKPKPETDNQKLLEALNSNDPQRWEQVTNTPIAQRSGWTSEILKLASNRTKDLMLHRREMETVLQGFATDPVQVKDRMMKWRSANRLTTNWDSRNETWVPADELWQEIERAADTVQAKKWLDLANQQLRGSRLGDVKDSIIRGQAFANADHEVLTELKSLLEQIKRPSATAGVFIASTASSSPLSQTALRSHPPGSLGELLEAPLRECETLTLLHISLSALSLTKTKYERSISKLAADLQIWVEEERWLVFFEDQQRNGSLQESGKSHAIDAIRNLENFIRAEVWRSYVTIDTPAFANMHRRLRAVAGANSGRSIRHTR